MNVYFTSMHEVIRVEMPGGVKIQSGRHVILVKLPEYIKAKGHMLLLFGGQSVTAFHLDSEAFPQAGYMFMGTEFISC